MFDSEAVEILLGASGGFSRHTVLHTGRVPFDIKVTELNWDGRDDLVIANRDGRDVSVFRGIGAALFAPPATVSVPGGAFSVIPNDFNNDGSVDLAVGGWGEISLVLGSSNGVFRETIVFRFDREPFRLIGVDFNRDGQVDLATPATGSSGGYEGILLFENVCASTAEVPTTSEFALLALGATIAMIALHALRPE